MRATAPATTGVAALVPLNSQYALGAEQLVVLR
jgi:hypothetical protein